MGRDKRCPAPLPLPRTQGSIAHANKPTPEREHASKQAGQRGGGTTLPHHPKQARQHQESANTPSEHTPNANTQPPASKHAHSKPQQVRPQANTRNVPTPTRVGTPSVSAGTRVLAEATGTNEAQTTNAGTQKQAHKSAQTTRFAYGVRLRPQGRTAREKAAHNSPRQSAWVVVFVGVFADVCRRFWAGWFGVLGVFWGCLACFLVF